MLQSMDLQRVVHDLATEQLQQYIYKKYTKGLPSCLLLLFLTNYHKLDVLKQNLFIISVFIVTSLETVGHKWVLCLSSHKAEIKVQVRPHSFLEAVEEESTSKLIQLLAECSFLQLRD